MRKRMLMEPPAAKRPAFYRAISWQRKADELYNMFVGVKDVPEYARVNCQNAAALASRNARVALMFVLGSSARDIEE